MWRPPDRIDLDAAGTPRRVHVAGTDGWAIDEASAQLEAAGHTVFRCNDPGAPAFPCNALRPGGLCPLDAGVDVVVTMRARPRAEPAVLEQGVICQLHAGVPLVIGGVAAAVSPFAPWAARVVYHGGDVVTACTEVPVGVPARQSVSVQDEE